MGSEIASVLISPLVAAVVAVLGWWVLDFLTRRREREARRLEGALQHLERQISELYGPLDGLIRTSNAMYEVALNVLPTVDDGKRLNAQAFSDGDYVAYHFLQEEYFLPLKKQMVEVLTTKLHLLESGRRPKSFDDFLLHQAAAEGLYRLSQAKGQSRWPRAPMGWPSEFGQDIAGSLARLLASQAQQMEALDRIRSSR